MLQILRLRSIVRSLKIGLSRRLIWRVLWIAFLSVIINAGQFYFFYSQTLDVLAEQLSFQLLPEEFIAVANSMPSMYEAVSNWLLLLLILQLALATIAGCWLSYRLYGPVDRIRLALVDISMGKLNTVVETRDGDELRDIAEDVTNSAARLQIMVLSMKENLERLNNCNLSQEQSVHLDIIRCNLEYFETIELNFPEEAEDRDDEESHH